MVLKLPIIAVPVRLAFVGSGPVAAELFVAAAPRRGRSQLLDDIAALMDQDAEFLPVRVDGVTKLVAKHALVWVSVPRVADGAIALPAEDDFEDFDMPSEVLMLYDRSHYVDVELGGGSLLRGALFDSAPADRPRAIDHLNRPGNFVRLWTEHEHFLVHKVHIRLVAEVERGTE